MSDCITFKIGINPYQDGNLDYEGFKNYIKTIGLNEIWLDLVDSTVENCFEQTNEKAEDLKISFALHPAFEGEKICHPFSGIFISCILANMITNCPTRLWDASE